MILVNLIYCSHFSDKCRFIERIRLNLSSYLNYLFFLVNFHLCVIDGSHETYFGTSNTIEGCLFNCNARSCFLLFVKVFYGVG
jgi:hypothetical protein